jgi:hypothetical protein
MGKDTTGNVVRELIEEMIAELTEEAAETGNEEGRALLPRFVAALRACPERDVLAALTLNSSTTTEAFSRRVDDLPHPREAMVRLMEAVPAFPFVDDRDQALMQRGFAVGWLAATEAERPMTIRERARARGGEAEAKLDADSARAFG